MKHLGIAVRFIASLCCAQEADTFQPSATNVWGAELWLAEMSSDESARFVRVPSVNFEPALDPQAFLWIGCTRPLTQPLRSLTACPSTGRIPLY